MCKMGKLLITFAASLNICDNWWAMRGSADWMTLSDDRILEYLSEVGPRRPGLIADEERFIWSSQTASNRCNKLAEYGLLKNLGNGLYQITDDGRAYLAGDLDAAELDPED